MRHRRGEKEGKGGRGNNEQQCDEVMQVKDGSEGQRGGCRGQAGWKREKGVREREFEKWEMGRKEAGVARFTACS